MSILSWLKSVTSGDTSTEQLTFAEGENDFKGLDMKAALDAHEKWYHRLEEMLNGTSDEKPEVATVACDDKCVLGQWIYAQGANHFGEHKEYNDLRDIHAEFHLTAADVLKNVLKGENVEARSGLKKVRHKSGGVQLALVRLYSNAKG